VAPTKVEHRSGEGKTRKEDIHSCRSILGEARARWFFHAWRKGKNGPQLTIGSWEETLKTIPVSFETHPVGTCPHGRRLSLSAILVERLHAPQSPVDWIPEPVSHQHSSTDQHRSAFTRGTDVPRNCLTLFCFQCTVSLFLHRSQKVEMLPARVETKREIFLPAGVRNPRLAAGSLSNANADHASMAPNALSVAF
jgi:hypothetical protein